ncbi:MAG: peptidase domain protein [Armatimonadetes bacterium]|jgi:predicted Zn-dependent peptidase|nr:peptidase domain protein [Armatimonadota bacterium]
MFETEVRETVLDNGLRVVSEYVPYVQSVSLGIRIDAGSRDETDAEAGISHVLEHMLFKGTATRTARDIAEQMDAVGGQIDAFTSKEYTGYGARVLPEHVPLAVDVVADMLRHSLIDEKELELEKSVILEECRSVEDAPEEFVHDLFNRVFWPEHPLGRPVIGFPPVISAITREDLLAYLAAYYHPRRMICVAAGNLDHDALVREVSTHFGDMGGSGPERELTSAVPAMGEIRHNRKLEQSHFCMGSDGIPENDPDRWAARVLSLLLGGGMSSRLFQEIREKRGLCYSIGTEMISYREGGMFIVYADTSPQQMEEVCALSRQELLNVVKNGITATELARAKDQVRAGTLLSLDDTGSRMNRLARNVLYQGRVIPLQELVGYVEAVSIDDCQRVAERMFGGGRFALAAIGPFPKRRTRTAKPAAN